MQCYCSSDLYSLAAYMSLRFVYFDFRIAFLEILYVYSGSEKSACTDICNVVEELIEEQSACFWTTNLSRSQKPDPLWLA